MFKRYWKILKPFHKTFMWFLLILALYEGLQIGEGYLMSFVIRLFGANAPAVVWIGLFVGLVIYDELFMRLDNQLDWHIIARIGYPLYKHLKLGAISKFLEMSIPWHQERNSGALVGKVANGVQKVQEIEETVNWEFLPTLIQTIFSIIPLLFFSPPTAAIAIFAGSFFIILTMKVNEARKPLRDKRHDLYEQEWHSAIEVVQAVETNLMFGQTGRLLQEQEKLHDEIIDLGTKEARIGIFTFNRWRIRVLTWSRRAILAIWVSQMYAGTLDIAGLIFINVLTEKLFHSFWRFARLLDKTAEASEGAERLATILEEKGHISPTGRQKLPKGLIDITLQDVCFDYKGTYTKDGGALHNLTLEIPGGSIVALVGPSGAGKTTIRKIITRLYEIQSGKITVGGIDVADWSQEALLNLFSYVPQGDDVFIFAGTLKENIAFPRPTASLGKVMAAAQKAGIHDFIAELPDGYNTLVGERGKRLSGGQKQRIALARAILADSPVLILDEATSAVDAVTERDIQNSMAEILKGKTAIIIAHRLATVWNIAHKIVVMEHGRIIEEGTHADLMKLNGLYAKMVALQTAESSV